MMLKSGRFKFFFCLTGNVKRTHPGCLRGIIANNIRFYRKMLGVSQHSFAMDIDMDRTYFGAVERGERNVSLDNIERIANGLGIEPWQLLKCRNDNGAA